MKLWALSCSVALLAGLGLSQASGQTNGSGRPIAIATPTPGPSGTASTALNSSLNSGPSHGGGSHMKTEVCGVLIGETRNGVVEVQASIEALNAAQAGTGSGTTPPIVPSFVTINSNSSSAGTGNVAGSVQINNGGPGSVTGAPVPVSPIPTYVTPGTGLGAAATGVVTVPNPNPGSVQ